MTQGLPVETAPLSPSTKKVNEKAAAIRKGFTRPKFYMTGFGWTLAACAGAANVIAFKTWGLYASHVTGSTSNIAFSLEGYHKGEFTSQSLQEASSLVFSFLVGAYACGLLIDKNQVHFNGKAFYGLALVLESALLILAAFLPGRLVPVCLVATACGLQNAMCTSHFSAIVRTTHVTGTMTDIGSTMGRISMIYLRKACRCAPLNAIERAEIGVDARKLAVLAGLWTFYLIGGLIGIYVENMIPGPRALLLPAFVTGSAGLFYMACRQLLKDYMKKMEKDRFDADLKEAKDALAKMNGRLHDIEAGGDRQLATCPKFDDGPFGHVGDCGVSVFSRSWYKVGDLDTEMGHMIEALREVEARIGKRRIHLPEAAFLLYNFRRSWHIVAVVWVP